MKTYELSDADLLNILEGLRDAGLDIDKVAIERQPDAIVFQAINSTSTPRRVLSVKLHPKELVELQRGRAFDMLVEKITAEWIPDTP
ncbi:hypothetical protein [Citricoccus sp. K5]|uniref:hypothetical protein n=1 Tax=Citricoccus sp. K5 TaxID=2653135 RepID=UPI0012F0626E|nr:hypothetical protein [Citricoccus sp. K5]VXB24101.1 hypothetical protein CITRIK5_30023 [Citricoccus sp. K5]